MFQFGDLFATDLSDPGLVLVELYSDQRVTYSDRKLPPPTYFKQKWYLRGSKGLRKLSTYVCKETLTTRSDTRDKWPTVDRMRPLVQGALQLPAPKRVLL